MTPEEELEEYLDEEIEWEDLAPPPFRIANPSTLNWALGKLKAKGDRLEAHEDLYAKEKAKLDTWIGAQRQAHEKGTTFLRTCVLEYLRQQEEAGLKPSASVPNGRAVLVKKGPQIVQLPEYAADLLAYAEPHGLVKRSVDWGALKKGLRVDGDAVVDSDGVIVPGVGTSVPEPVVTITLAKG